MWKAILLGSALAAGCGSGKSTEPTPVPSVERTPSAENNAHAAATFESCLFKSTGADAIPLPEFLGRVEACKNSAPGLSKGEFVKILQRCTTMRASAGGGREVRLSKNTH